MPQINEWANNNRQGFLDWVYRTFNHEKRDVKTPFGELFPHQVFVRNFMEYNSPYRGLLLYHGLGSGKTASSIAAAEGFINKNKKIIVLLPASLEMNYRDEIMKHASSGNPTKKLWSYIEIKKIATKQADAALALDVSPNFLKKNSKIWFPFSEGLPPNAVLRKDIAWKDLEESEQRSAKATLKEIINKNYTFIRYNGITQSALAKYKKDFFNDAFIVVDEVHNFVSRVVNGSKITRSIYTKIMDASNIKLVLLTGTPIINHPFELSIMLNLVRGYINVYEFPLLKDAVLPEQRQIDDILTENKFAKFIDQYFVLNQEKKILITLLPEGFVNDGDGKMKAIKGSSSENTTSSASGTASGTSSASGSGGGSGAGGSNAGGGMTSTDIIKGLNSEIAKHIRVAKRTQLTEMFTLPTNKDDFNNLFLDETDRENPRVKNNDLFKRRILGTVSYVKNIGSEYFPTVLPKVIEQIPLSDHQFSKYLIVRDEERVMERRSRQNKGGVMAKKTSVYRAFSRMACNFVFPNNIERPFPKDLRKALKMEIDREESDEESDDEDDKNEAAKGNDKHDKIDKVKLKKDYEEIIKTSIKKLADDPSLLSIENLRTLYSPKFAKIIERVNSTEGKCLIYSQFRTVEGLGVLRLALISAGYKEVHIEKKSKENDSVIWNIVDEEEVLDAKYDGKRFIVFDTDREKANILLQLYNGIYNNIEETRPGSLKANLRGEMFKTFMITQSGAEGISLKNVRCVLITEPFWNSVRIDQVIGRAARAGSHLELPKDEQNVSVYIYTSIFTKKQLKDNFSLRSLDNELTSDAHIMQIALKKDEIIQAFQNNLKTASVDCRTNATLNELDLGKGMQCYSFPIPIDNDAYAFVPDIRIDNDSNNGKGKGDKHKIVRTRKIKGKVVSYKGKKYVIVDDYPNKFFNYTLYKNAGILQEEEIR